MSDQPAGASHRNGPTAGFTIVELLIVVAVLGILAGIVVYAVGSANSDSKTSACAADRKTLQRALEAYKVRHGAYPTELTGLVGSSAHVRDNGTITASSKVGEGYTIGYDGAGGLTDCPAAIQAGGGGTTGGGTTGGATTGGGTTGGATTGGATTGGPSATSMTATVTAGGPTFTGNGSNRVWTVVMTVAATDNLGAAVDNAVVTAGWAFAFDGNAQNRGTGSKQTTCTTASDGRCTLTGQGFESNVKTATITVSGLTGSLSWSQQGSSAVTANRPF